MLKEIFNEDCLETMNRLPDCSVDLIITSPPYNKAGYEGFKRNRHERDSWKSRNIEYGGDADNDFVDESIYRENQIKVLNEFQRVLKKDGSVFYNHKVRVAQHKASHPIEWILKSNLCFRQQIIWDRKGSPALAPIRYLPSTEIIFHLTKTAIQPNFERSKDCLFKGEVWVINPTRNENHPCSFPIEIPENIMMCVKNKTDDFIVYDPYFGSGTTLFCAEKFGFNFIGSEINEIYFNDVKNKIFTQ